MSLAFFIPITFQANANVDERLGDTFGNYMLHGIQEIHLPESITWWPQTVAWKISLVLFLLWLGKRLTQFVIMWRRNAYRRIALKRLAQLEISIAKSPNALKQLPVLLKSTALHAYPRTSVAHLSGSAWLSMLDSTWHESTFNAPLGQRLLAINYQSQEHWNLEPDQVSELINTIRRWIKQHHANNKAEHV